MTDVTRPLKNPPRVSIGMPVYNGGKYIREALGSLLGQTFADFELVISDNASTDSTEAICREFAGRDPRIRYVRHAENRGSLSNFKFLLAEAAGEYFMWAAADDVWDKDYIETLLPVSAEYKCLSYGSLHAIDAGGEKIDHIANGRRFEYIGNRLIRRLRYFAEPAFLGKANPIYGLFPAAKLKSIGIGVMESENSDLVFLYEVLAHMEIRYAGPVCLYKRIHGDSADLSAGGEAPGPVDPGFISKTLRFRQKIVSALMLPKYLRQSGFFQAVLLLCVYPFCVVYLAAYAILFKVRPWRPVNPTGGT